MNYNINKKNQNDFKIYDNYAFSNDNIKNTNNKKDRVIFKIVSFFALVFFCLNIILISVLYFNVKNNINKKININYYNVSVDENKATTFAVQNSIKSSVCIAAGGFAYDEDSFFEQTSSRGSGVIFKIDDNSDFVYILTCFHVVSGYNSIYVLFPMSLEPVTATIVGFTEYYDIAVLKTKIPFNIFNYKEIDIRDSQFLSVGENVFAVGNSLSGGISVTDGVISRLNKEVVIEGETFREIQTDASINPGNSGGGLFDINGNFVGLINAKLSSITSSNVVMSVEGTAFAIPSNFSVSIAESIIKNLGKPTFVDFGLKLKNSEKYVSELNIDNNLIFDYEVRVEKIDKNSFMKDFLKENDIILSFKYFNLSGELKEVLMTNKFCLEDVIFDIKENSNIEFKIIQPLFGDEYNIVVTIPAKIIQN